MLSSDQVLDCDESVVFDAASRWLLAPSESPPRQRHAPEVKCVLCDSYVSSLNQASWGVMCDGRTWWVIRWHGFRSLQKMLFYMQRFES